MGCQFSCLKQDSLVYNGLSLDEGYLIQEGIESTESGIMRKGYSKEGPPKLYSISSIYKKKCENYHLLANEINILQNLEHVNIKAIYDIYETDEVIHVVSDIYEDKNLHQMMKERKKLSEGETKNIIRQVLQGINYLHSEGICHRNLRPDSILFQKEVPVIAGFQYAVLQTRNTKDVAAGLPFFKAPEGFQGTYSLKSDIWAIGVLTYMMLTGTLPFQGNSSADIKESVNNKQYSVPEDLSSGAGEFLSCLLEVDQMKRCSSKLALKHPWLNA